MKDALLLEQKWLGESHGLRLTLERVRLPNGYEIELPMVHHPGAAVVLPFANDNDITLIRQYRWAVGGWILEAPAGKLSPQEDPAACALRELEEETGQRAGRIEPLGWIWTVPGFSDERIYLFAAYDLHPVSRAPEPDELIEVIQMPFAEAVERAGCGDITDAKTLAVLFRASRARSLSKPEG